MFFFIYLTKNNKNKRELNLNDKTLESNEIQSSSNKINQAEMIQQKMEEKEKETKIRLLLFVRRFWN